MTSKWGNIRVLLGEAHVRAVAADVARDSLRGKLADIIALIESVPGEPNVDIVAPDTQVSFKRDSEFDTRATLIFTGSDDKPGPLTFEYSLDGGPWTATDATLALDVAVGVHRLMARAIDAAGNADLTPAFVDWTVKPKPPEEPEEPPEPVVVTGALQLWDGKTGVSPTYSNYGLHLFWRNKGAGDWLDADQIPQGPRPFATGSFPADRFSFTCRIDVTELYRRFQTANSGMMVRATGTLHIATRRHATIEWRPSLEFVLADGSTQRIEAHATPAISGSSAPEILTIAKLNSSRFMLAQSALAPAGWTKVELLLTNTSQYGGTVRIFEVHQQGFYDFAAHSEGAVGIAANVDEAEIEKHPEVYYAEDFTPKPDGPLRDWQRQFFDHSTDWRNNVPVQLDEFGKPYIEGKIRVGVSGSNVSYSHEWTRGYVRHVGDITERFNPHNGLQTTEVFPKGSAPDPMHPACPRELYMRYEWEAEPGFQCHIEGNKIPGPAGQLGIYERSGARYGSGDGNGGAPTNGYKDHTGHISGWSMRSLKKPAPNDGNPYGMATTRPIPMGTYAYHCDQGGSWGDFLSWGNDVDGWVVAEEGRRYSIEIRAKVNTVRARTPEEAAARVAERTAYRDDKIAYHQARIVSKTKIIAAADVLEAEAAAGAVLTYMYVEAKGVPLTNSLETAEHDAILAAVIKGRAEARYDLAKATASVEEWTMYPLPVFDESGYDQWGNGIGERDGIVEVWMHRLSEDGTRWEGGKVFSRTNFLLRHHPAGCVESAWFDHLHGGSAAAEVDHKFKVAYPVLARSRIGPRKLG